MSLKKDIMNLVKSDEGSAKVNNITTLRRWTKNALGEDIDRMTATFEYVAGVKGGFVFDIASRDYNGIISSTYRYLVFSNFYGTYYRLFNAT